MSVTPTVDANDLDDIDRAILDFLKKDRETGDPWGIATPATVLEYIEREDILPEEDIPVRQTVNSHMKFLAAAGHLNNRYNKGEYVFVSDPREEADDADT